MKCHVRLQNKYCRIWTRAIPRCNLAVSWSCMHSITVVTTLVVYVVFLNQRRLNWVCKLSGEIRYAAVTLQSKPKASSWTWVCRATTPAFLPEVGVPGRGIDLSWAWATQAGLRLHPRGSALCLVEALSRSMSSQRVRYLGSWTGRMYCRKYEYLRWQSMVLVVQGSNVSRLSSSVSGISNLPGTAPGFGIPSALGPVE
jgi:hypothetical protein